MADTFIAAPDLIALLERAITAEYRFALLHAAAPGPEVLLDTRMTQDLLGWRAAAPVPTRLGRLRVNEPTRLAWRYMVRGCAVLESACSATESPGK